MLLTGILWCVCTFSTFMYRYKIAGSIKEVCKEKDEAASFSFFFFLSILLWSALATERGREKLNRLQKKKTINKCIIRGFRKMISELTRDITQESILFYLKYAMTLMILYLLLILHFCWTTNFKRNSSPFEIENSHSSNEVSSGWISNIL